jgi:ribosomal protein S18 acetylase RimI-like enzyme
MPDLSLVRALEERLINAWPAFEIEVADGWILRFAEGYSKRANAATPLVPGAQVDPGLIDHVLHAFEERGVAPCFRLTGIEDRRCEEVLAAKGLVDFDPSVCMVAPLGAELELDPSVEMRTAPKPNWIEAAANSYGGEKANADRLGRIVRLIRQPAAFATLSLDGEASAWGLAVAERGYVGLYDIVVAPSLRGFGLGRRLVVSLMAWGRDQGASHAYLQVREANEVAAALYASLGFETGYRYTHRVLPPPLA